MLQLTLTGFGPVVARVPQTTRLLRTPRPSVREPDDDITRAYLRRLAARGSAPKGIAAYRYQLRSIRRVAGRLAGLPVTLTTASG